MRGGWLRSNSRSWEVHSGQYFGRKGRIEGSYSHPIREARLLIRAPIDTYSNVRRRWPSDGFPPGGFSAFPQMRLYVELGISQFLRLSAKRLASTKSPMIMLS